ncbi:LeuA family protein [Streptomyces sp. NPDC021093]|uniref:LeuA family protein n=1 Tax=Streptomyces sp. NPDC021093 TaxID=3365112 RepID=UPI003790CDD7
MSELRRISVFDTTLRDGEQAPGNAMNADQKLEVALAIEQLGVDLIETGFPAASSTDFKATRMMSERLVTARLASFCRSVPKDVEVAVEAGGTERHQIQLLATGSDLHLEHKRGITRAQAYAEVRRAVEVAKGLGVTDISVGIEDASRGELDLLRGYVDLALEAGATTLALGETSGCMVPAEFGELTGRVREWLPASVVLSIHCHDDFGLAVANTLAGLEAGADEMQVTLGGIGERAGNAALEELAAVLLYKGAHYGFTTGIRTERLHAAYQVLTRAISMPTPRNKAIFGEYAFATQAGIHQAGMLAKPETYEYLEPTRVGRERSMLVGRHSGRAILTHLLDQLGVTADNALLDELYHDYIASREGGECDELHVVRESLSRRFARQESAAVRQESAVVAAPAMESVR